MRSKQIKSNNTLYPSAVNNKLVETKEYNDLQLDVEDIVSSMSNNLVPYDGAISDINIGYNSLITDAIQFNTDVTPITNVEGLLQWNATDGTLDLGVRGGLSTQQIGQEITLPAYNDTGSAITEGVPVYVSGRHSHLPKITPARSDSQETSVIFGITTTTFGTTGNFKNGLVTVLGYVRQIKTNYSGNGNWGTTWVTNDKLYVSKTVAGQLTNVAPTVPHHSDIVATVAIVGAVGSGTVLVLNQKHTTLDDLTDVDGTPLTVNGQVLAWNETSKYWDANVNINDYYLKAGGNIGGASHYTNFDATGHQTMVGSAKPWDDLRIEPSVRQAAGTGVPSFEKYFDDSNNTSRGVFLYSFTNETTANQKEVFFTTQMPHTWDSGPILMHIHWVPAATENATEVIWGLEYCWKDIGEVYADTTIIYSSGTLVPDDANITARKHYISEFTDITPGSTADALSSILIGRIFRFSGDASDTYTNKVGLMYIDAHYQLNSLGSTDKYNK